eukprot:TRINITY_DN3407_c0_g2_i1.p1 TRINITY_DN3407_c0_g2~~TRINITY_DN3407_c0_g2_i1.p1  ORF type:complete len:143 (-),score=15.06 TRINITY_DN3407_c0_g2_i1:67-495(-)
MFLTGIMETGGVIQGDSVCLSFWFFFFRHLSLQYLTSIQTLSSDHFERRVKGLKHTGQVLNSFMTPLSSIRSGSPLVGAGSLTSSSVFSFLRILEWVRDVVDSVRRVKLLWEEKGKKLNRSPTTTVDHLLVSCISPSVFCTS